MTVGVWKNGVFSELANFPSVDRGSTPEFFYAYDTTIALNNMIYILNSNRVLAFDPVTKTSHDVYRPTVGDNILSITASKTARKLYIRVAPHFDPQEETYMTEMLLEMDIDTEAVGEIARMNKKPYTHLRYIANTRRKGDVIYCMCGGEGSGTWQTYYLHTADGRTEVLRDINHGNKRQESIFDYAYDLDSLVGKYTSYTDPESYSGEESEIFLYNIYSQEEKSTGIRANTYFFILSDDARLLVAFTRTEHAIYSFPDGELIRKRTIKNPKTYHPFGFLSTTEKTLWTETEKPPYDQPNDQKTLKMNYDGVDPVVTSIAPEGFHPLEKPLGRDNELLFYKVEPVGAKN